LDVSEYIEFKNNIQVGVYKKTKKHI
jgi:hypothetical protein